ncbi:YidC/Oxa1 family membrane protein insertase [Candidatus Gottesmanbacteria bacterium]|nr:YidC/Oxa1 family membrane protein insertase [Candidatus Gottesmanbacteria bacterium]
MTNPGIFNQILIWPILNILIALYKIFEALRAPGAFGLAIIGLTILIRFLLSPLFSSQLKSAQKMQELKPKIDELSQKYGKDKARIQQEQLRLYKEAGVNPAAGCLPLLLQMPVFIALYNVFWQILGNGNLEKVIQDIN